MHSGKTLSSSRTADFARLIAVPAIWGGTFVGGKIVVAALTPLMGSFARYVIACILGVFMVSRA